jgi:hypothetical protein
LIKSDPGFFAKRSYLKQRDIYWPVMCPHRRLFYFARVTVLNVIEGETVARLKEQSHSLMLNLA